MVLRHGRKRSVAAIVGSHSKMPTKPASKNIVSRRVFGQPPIDARVRRVPANTRVFRLMISRRRRCNATPCVITPHAVAELFTVEVKEVGSEASVRELRGKV